MDSLRAVASAHWWSQYCSAAEFFVGIRVGGCIRICFYVRERRDFRDVSIAEGLNGNGFVYRAILIFFFNILITIDKDILLPRSRYVWIMQNVHSSMSPTSPWSPYYKPPYPYYTLKRSPSATTLLHLSFASVSMPSHFWTILQPGPSKNFAHCVQEDKYSTTTATDICWRFSLFFTKGVTSAGGC